MFVKPEGKKLPSPSLYFLFSLSRTLTLVIVPAATIVVCCRFDRCRTVFPLTAAQFLIISIFECSNFLMVSFSNNGISFIKIFS